MGPFETIDLNAPGGVADYANRFGTFWHEIAKSRTYEEPWQPELIRKVEDEGRSLLSLDDLASRRAWRDRRLMASAVRSLHRRLPADDDLELRDFIELPGFRKSSNCR
jgi:L-gulonate 3-dehydrogenase